MKIKDVRVGIIKDSRGKDTIIIGVNNCITSAPAGKSKGKHEVPCYRKTIKDDFKQIKLITELGQKDFKKFDTCLKMLWVS